MEISGREVSDEILRKVIGAAFKAPTNDHLRQLEFVVVRGGEYAACGRKRRLGARCSTSPWATRPTA